MVTFKKALSFKLKKIIFIYVFSAMSVSPCLITKNMNHVIIMLQLNVTCVHAIIALAHVFMKHNQVIYFYTCGLKDNQIWFHLIL